MQLRCSSLPPPSLSPMHTTSQHLANSTQLDSWVAHLVRPRQRSHKDMRPSDYKKLESSLSAVPYSGTCTISARNSGVVLSSGSSSVDLDPHAADIVQTRKSSRRASSTNPSTKLESSINQQSKSFVNREFWLASELQIKIMNATSSSQSFQPFSNFHQACACARKFT